MKSFVRLTVTYFLQMKRVVVDGVRGVRNFHDADAYGGGVHGGSHFDCYSFCALSNFTERIYNFLQFRNWSEIGLKLE